MKSQNSEIEVFLCPEDPGVKSPLSPGFALSPGSARFSTKKSLPPTTKDADITAKNVDEPTTSLDSEKLESQNENQINLSCTQNNSEYILGNTDSKVKLEPVSSICNSMQSTNEMMLSSIASSGMRDALLCESDDYDLMGGGKLQLQTDDHHMTSGIEFLNYLFFGFSRTNLFLYDILRKYSTTHLMLYQNLIVLIKFCKTLNACVRQQSFFLTTKIRKNSFLKTCNN